jgi:glycosyltransferase involved in cell wall biosynthesis
MKVSSEAIPVLFVLPSLGTGGSERVVYNLCLNAAPHFIPVVAAFRDGALRQEMQNSGIACHVLDRRGGIDISLIFKLRKIIANNGVRLVNSHHFVSLFYAFWAARTMRLPVMHTEHSKWEMEALSPFWNRCYRFFLKNIQMVNAVSAAAFQHLQKEYGLGESKAAYIPNGIDMKLFRPQGGAGLRASMGIKETDLVIGTVGNLRPEKNQALLIRAAGLLKEWGFSSRIVVVGDGPCRAELEELAVSQGVKEEVKFLGTRTDAASLYAMFDVYSLSSRYEGMPLTVLEAMSAGVPVIGTKVLGIAEVIIHGENGLLVPDNDVAHLAAAIALLSGDQGLRKKIAGNGYRFVEENYLLQSSVNRYKSLFLQLA